MQKEEIKKEIGKKAAEFVQDGMIIGLGTGSTSAAFIRALALLQKEIVATATSIASEELALSLGIRCLPISEITHIDITFDGADEVDPQKRLIKGAGGALLREKIVATASRELIIMVDEEKLVPKLGHAKIPVEIIPFGHALTIQHLNALGFHGALRLQNQKPYITDNHNYIYDIQLKAPTDNPERLALELSSVVGVVETGFFFNPVKKLIVGLQNGTVESKK